MYELAFLRQSSTYILLTDDSAAVESDAHSLCIIQADSVAEALRTARTIANGPVELAP